MHPNIDYSAHLDSPSPTRNRLLRFTRARLVGFAGAVLMVSLYFGTVVWMGNELAADMKAGTKQVTAGMMVPDLEG